jgi:hypothetical protein
MSTPVSWLMIESGWRVEAADGTELGHVEEVTGDSNADIFDGLSISASPLARPRYVPAEQVGEIVDGRVRLKLDRAGFESLGEFKEPPEQVTIEPEKASVLERADSAVGPSAQRSQRVGLVQRVLDWFGRAGKR